MIEHVLGATVCALFNGRNDRALAARWAHEHGFPKVAAAMRSDRAASGGAWIPSTTAGDIIELLRPRSAVLSLDPMRAPLDGGNLTIRKVTGGSTAYYKGEAQRGTISEATAGAVHLVAKQLMAMVPVSSSLARAGGADIIQADVVESLAQRGDLAFIRGDGTEHTPTGLRHLAAAANIIPANATVNLANVTTDLGKLVLALENANVRMIRPGWVMAPRTKRYLMDVRDGNGAFAFRSELNDGTLEGFPYRVTTQIPTNLGSGSDESELYLSDFADVVVGEVPGVRVEVLREASYHDGVEWISAAQNDEVVVRAVAEHDIGLRHDEAVAVLTEVKWGA